MIVRQKRRAIRTALMLNSPENLLEVKYG